MHRSHNHFDPLPKIIQVNLSGEIKLYLDRVQRQLVKSIDEIIGNYKSKIVEFIEF